MMANNMREFRQMVTGSYSGSKIVKASVNKEISTMYYCNQCQKEEYVRNKDTHACDEGKKENMGDLT